MFSAKGYLCDAAHLDSIVRLFVHLKVCRVFLRWSLLVPLREFCDVTQTNYHFHDVSTGCAGKHIYTIIRK